MASEFLQKRFAAMLKTRAGDTTVQYIPFDNSSADDLTGDVDEAAAYSAVPVPLPALIECNPSRALREKVGLELHFDAVLTLADQHLTEADINLKIGDAFILPDDEHRFHTTKILRDMQAEDQFLSRLVAVSRKVGSR